MAHSVARWNSSIVHSPYSFQNRPMYSADCLRALRYTSRIERSEAGASCSKAQALSVTSSLPSVGSRARSAWRSAASSCIFELMNT